MSTSIAEQAKAPIVEGFARFWTDPNTDILPQILAEDVVGYFAGQPGPLHGRKPYIAWIARLLEQLPDLRLEVTVHATNGDATFIQWIARATGNNGPFEFSGIDLITVRDGLVTENTVVFDTALLRTLSGLEPA